MEGATLMRFLGSCFFLILFSICITNTQELNHNTHQYSLSEMKVILAKIQNKTNNVVLVRTPNPEKSYGMMAVTMKPEQTTPFNITLAQSKTFFDVETSGKSYRYILSVFPRDDKLYATLFSSQPPLHIADQPLHYAVYATPLTHTPATFFIDITLEPPPDGISAPRIHLFIRQQE